MALAEQGLKKRAARALERQLAYQRAKAAYTSGREAAAIAYITERARRAREQIEAIRPIPADARVLEVGCGSMGLIFFFDRGGERVGVDPLADHYAKLFPAWYSRARTVATGGESLPFPDASFDLVLCDNVVDHAEDPRRIVEEIARVLAPSGLLYFTVHVHHPFYRAAAALHAGWRALGLPFEITPFADHTVHFTLDDARGLFAGLPLRPLVETADLAALRRSPPGSGPLGWIRRLFFKNARYELIAVWE